MSDDANPPKRDNASPEHQPKNVVNENAEPKGTVRRASSRLGFGVPVNTLTVTLELDEVLSREIESAHMEKSELSPEDERKVFLDNLPADTVLTPLTGDEDVDKQSIDNGDVVVTEQELEYLKDRWSGTEDPIEQSDFQRAFQRARDRTGEVQKINLRDKGPSLE